MTDKLREIIGDLKGVVIAFSGGVDSTLLARICKEELGNRALAVTAKSETYSRAELEDARKIAREIGIEHLVIETSELEIKDFAKNPPERCYFCKKELFSKLREIADERGLRHVVDGLNADDLDDFRPGVRAAKELGIRSPLMEAGLGKEDIRKISHDLGLPTWNKPSLACLASRFPYGEEITREKLERVSQAEEFLKSLNLGQLRVRHHGNTARIELNPEEFQKAIKLREKIVKKFKELGYTYITLDLQGYRTGSMNEALQDKK